MGKFITLVLIGLASCLAFFAPWIYLIGILTSYVPTYLFLFKKSVRVMEENAEEDEYVYLSEDRLEHENMFAYMFRKVVIVAAWGVICTLLWWLLLLISMSKDSTERFITGFAKGAK